MSRWVGGADGYVCSCEAPDDECPSCWMFGPVDDAPEDEQDDEDDRYAGTDAKETDR